MAAQIPAIPAAPVTTWYKETDEVVVTWVAPDNGGSPITSYSIFIRESDSSTYSEEPISCNGADATILAEAKCTIPVSALKAAPFELPWGTNVHAKVLATNIYGSSAKSLAGFGAIITTNPDPPINFIENYSLRSPTTLGMTWEAAAFIGGADIIDFRILIAETGQELQVLSENLLTPAYTAISLTPGVTYDFAV